MNVDLTLTKEIIAIAAFFVVLVVVAAILKSRPKKLNPDYFKDKWQKLQKQCAKQEMWPMAIIDADKLLDEALKKRHYKGKTMGERLVSAQHDLTDNDGVWYGHKLRNQIVHESYNKLTQPKIKEALLGFKQALKDLGAL